MTLRFACGRFDLDLRRTHVMGIVNVTPDSFSDGGRYRQTDDAIAHAKQLIAEGADLLDIGGESTRPGAPAVSVEEEKRRVLPVIEALREHAIPLSVDTRKPEVMSAALAAGADIINDVEGFQRAESIQALARNPRCGVVIMHMQGTPQTMQAAPHYHNVVSEVRHMLLGRAQRLRQAGWSAARILLDPGLGFGKSTAHNLALLSHLAALLDTGYGVLVGGSRKSMLGELTGRPVGERLAGSLALALAAAANGAGIVRVHDVAATIDALTVWRSIFPVARNPQETTA